jgi:ankyrin repeat protein
MPVEDGRTSIARLLLNGSDKDSTNHAGKTALKIATERGNSDLARRLHLLISLSHRKHLDEHFSI